MLIKEPTLPILSMLPVLPILKILPALPTLRILPTLPILSMLPALNIPMKLKMLSILCLLAKLSQLLLLAILRDALFVGKVAVPSPVSPGIVLFIAMQVLLTLLINFIKILYHICNPYLIIKSVPYF